MSALACSPRQKLSAKRPHPVRWWQRPRPPTPSVAPTEVERVIVTGSNIPTAAEVGPNPVDILNRDQIDKAGERTTADLVRNLTVAGPNGVPFSNNGAGLTPGASTIAFRGFDASSTVVLIDGHRVASYPLGTDNGAVTFVDLNSIPKAAIDSIEILKDGASSIYGADAVAGVHAAAPDDRVESLIDIQIFVSITACQLTITRRH